eukprot:12898387-Ditylum_brightwellii.AAC.1
MPRLDAVVALSHEVPSTAKLVKVLVPAPDNCTADNADLSMSLMNSFDSLLDCECAATVLVGETPAGVG